MPGWALLAVGFLLVGTSGCRCGGSSPTRRGKGTAVEVIDPEELSRPKASAEREPNDSFRQAQDLPPEGGIEGTIGEGRGKSGDRDWYRVAVLGDNQILTATLSGVAELDLVLEAWGGGGAGSKTREPSRLVRVSNGKEGEGETLVNLAVSKGEVLILVREAKGRAAAGRYRLSYSLRAIEEGEEREPNYKASLASPLPVGGEATGYLGWHTDTDWYRVELGEVAEGARLRVEYDGLDEVRANLSLRSGDGKALQERWGGPGEPIVLANLAVGEGQRELFLVVRCSYQANVETRYSLRAHSAVPPGPTEAEPNDAPTTATPLLPGTTVSGTLGDTVDRDLYSVQVSQAGLMRVQVSPPLGLDLALALLGEDGKVILEVDEGEAREPEVIPLLELRPGRTLLQVRAPKRQSLNSVSPYKLKIEPLPAGTWEREPNDLATSATALPAAGSELRGFLHPKRDVDCFRVSGNGATRFSVATPRLRAKLELLDPAGASIAAANVDSAGTARVSAELVAGKEYLLRLTETGGAGNPREPYLLKLEKDQ